MLTSRKRSPLCQFGLKFVSMLRTCPNITLGIEMDMTNFYHKQNKVHCPVSGPTAGCHIIPVVSSAFRPDSVSFSEVIYLQENYCIFTVLNY